MQAPRQGAARTVPGSLSMVLESDALPIEGGQMSPAEAHVASQQPLIQFSEDDSPPQTLGMDATAL